jgi:medium-chain acyl-[acyl-carrier-protein] hydrolase
MMNITVTKKTSANQWLTCSKANPQAQVRLFCFPYAGGGAQIYHKWHTGLPKSVEVCPVQLPGRGNRIMDPPYTQLMPLVRAVATAILPSLDKPFIFFGHSMGAMIGFELTRLLRKHYALQPLHLFVSGRTAPQISVTDPLTYNLPEQEFLEDLHQLKGTPKELLENAELMQFMLPLLRADFEVCQTYSYVAGPPLTCPLTIFGGLQDEKIGYDNFAAWKEQTSNQFLLRMFPGDHFFINSAQSLLLETLSRELDHIVSHNAHLSSQVTAMAR